MNKQITIKENQDLEYSSFLLHKNGLEPLGKPTFEQWEEVGKFIRKANGAVHFWIGDWINYGESAYGEKYSQALDHTDFEKGTLQNDSYVAKNVDISRRREDVPFSVYQELAPFAPQEQEKLLNEVTEKGLTRQQLRKEKHKILLDAKRPYSGELDFSLLLGDAKFHLNTLPDQSIDCVVTDAPYGIDYQSNRRVVNPQLDKLENDQDQAFQLLDDVCEILSKKVKPNSHLYFFTSWKVYSKFEAIISKYFSITNVLVWDKLNHGTGDLEGNYGEQYELIIFANTGRRILNGNRPTNILAVSRPANVIHPTEKPEALLKKLIEVSTNENELVVDPFMGSGSTCKAAKDLKRRYLGIEIDEQWYQEAQRRLNVQ